jgi:hypothetical protein
MTPLCCAIQAVSLCGEIMAELLTQSERKAICRVLAHFLDGG